MLQNFASHFLLLFFVFADNCWTGQKLDRLLCMQLQQRAADDNDVMTVFSDDDDVVVQT